MTTRPVISLVAAVARNGVIGRGNQMPWRLPEDLRFLRQLTMGAPVLMGRSTWESLPARFRPLPGRRNIVLSRQAAYRAEGAEVAADLDQALGLVTQAERIFVIGGAQIYAEALSRADELVLTEIDRDFDGDTHFPAWPRQDFVEVSRLPQQAAPPNDFGFAFVTYRRR